MANYYDRVLEDFGDAVLDDAYDDAYDDAFEDDFGEAKPKKRPGQRLPGSIGRSSNFGKNISAPPAAGGNFVTKGELKNSLNSISQQVNDLKRSSLSIAAGLKKVDDGYDKIIRGVAKKDKAQDAVMNNSVLMTMMGTLINKPVLDPTALTIVDTSTEPASATTLQISDTPKSEAAVSIDPVKAMLFAMLPIMMNGGSGGMGDNTMMMMVMMLMLSGGAGGSLLGGSGDTTLILVVMMMMMMNKK